MKRGWLGEAVIRPNRAVVAGSWCSLAFQYRAGHSIDETGCIKIAFRFAGDFGIPQFDQPRQPNYCTVATSGHCRIEPRWDPKGHTRPWDRALFLKIMGGYLDRGETLTVRFGDTAHGSPGWRMQTFCERSFEFKTLVDPFATYQFKELPRSPTLQIVAGRPAKRVIIAPSRVLAGRRFRYHVKDEDVWGNPCGVPRARVHPGFAKPGIRRCRVGRVESNPIEVVATASRLQPYWADLHGQSEETIGTNSIEDYFRFARDMARLDVAGHQGNDFQITDEFWRSIQIVTRRVTQPGHFVTFPSYEWSGNTPLGGDRNVYFLNERGVITRSCHELLPGNYSRYPLSPTASDLFRNLKKQRLARPFCVAHVGGRYADLATHDADLEWAVEIYSSWGTFEWLLEQALQRGYRVGICAGSDDHKGRPGAAYPGAGQFGTYGGLTCVLARSLTREHIYAALKARHFYATTGHRCLLDVRLDTGRGQPAMMGDVVTAGNPTPRLHIRVAGTAPIERVDIRNGCRTIATLRPFDRADLGRRIKLLWSGAECRGRARMVDWSGALRVKNNTVRRVIPIQFWNPARWVAQRGPRRVEWQSVTTGGAAGCILELEHPYRGRLLITTRQGRATFPIKRIGLNPLARSFGGLEKQIAVHRLPDQLRQRDFDDVLPVEKLQRGDNPIYIRVTQVDGHQAWSSPIFLVK